MFKLSLNCNNDFIKALLIFQQRLLLRIFSEQFVRKGQWHLP